jgi:hypothetical protein
MKQTVAIVLFMMAVAVPAYLWMYRYADNLSSSVISERAIPRTPTEAETTVIAGSGDVIPESRRSQERKVLPSDMKVGDQACVFPVTASYENHVWFRKDDLEKGACVYGTWIGETLIKTESGWRIYLTSRLGPIGSDEEFKHLGYIRVTEVVAK